MWDYLHVNYSKIWDRKGKKMLSFLIGLCAWLTIGMMTLWNFAVKPNLKESEMDVHVNLLLTPNFQFPVGQESTKIGQRSISERHVMQWTTYIQMFALCVRMNRVCMAENLLITDFITLINCVDWSSYIICYQSLKKKLSKLNQVILWKLINYRLYQISISDIYISDIYIWNRYIRYLF